MWLIFCAYTVYFNLFYYDYDFSLASIFCTSYALHEMHKNMYCAKKIRLQYNPFKGGRAQDYLELDMVFIYILTRGEIIHI